MAFVWNHEIVWRATDAWRVSWTWNVSHAFCSIQFVTHYAWSAWLRIQWTAIFARQFALYWTHVFFWIQPCTFTAFCTFAIRAFCAHFWALLALLLWIDCYELKSCSAAQTFGDLDRITHAAIKRTLDTSSICGDRESKLTCYADSAVRAVIAVFRAGKACFVFIDLNIFIDKISNFAGDTFNRWLSRASFTVFVTFFTSLRDIVPEISRRTYQTVCIFVIITDIANATAFRT